MDRFSLAQSAEQRISLLKGAGLSGAQRSRIKALGSPDCMSGFELWWAVSLANAILDAYHEPEDNLLRITELVSIDGEGYLYFDGIRGDNISNGVDHVVWDKTVAQKAKAFEQCCMTALLSGRTVQERNLPTLAPAA